MFENHIKSLAFNIASEPSSVYILTGQKFIKNAKKIKCDILGDFSNTVTWSLKYLLATSCRRT